MTKRRLGRGLDGLLPPASGQASSHTGREAPIETVHPNRAQPRRRFDEAALEELAQSIREHGILEPILVRKRPQSGYEIVCGERRWRAAQRAGLHQVPIFVRELNEQSAFEAALVENLQREDLSPTETARAYQRLADEFEMTQEAIALRVGKSRSAVANVMRLLQLPSDILEMIEIGQLSEGHGRALLGSPDTKQMMRFARLAAEQNLSVRDIERRVRAASKGAAPPPQPPIKSANIRALEQRLSRSLGSTVTVEDRSGKGRIVIQYSSLEELDQVLTKLV